MPKIKQFGSGKRKQFGKTIKVSRKKQIETKEIR